MPPEDGSTTAGEQSASAPSVRALTCPACGGTVTLRAAGYTVTVICHYCGSVLDVADPDVKLVQEYQRQAAQLAIPLGTRGILKGIEWEAIGYLERSQNGSYPWSEFLLFNPYHGYRWLITDGRGWSFGTMLTDAPSKPRGILIYADEQYSRFFDEAENQVDYVLGEFYWRVAVGETVKGADWVRPGWMLSKESNQSEVSWTLSELLRPEEMKRGFGVEPPRNPWPPLPHQPSPYSGEAGLMTKIGFATAGLLFFLFLFFSGGPKVADIPLSFTTGTGEQSATIGPIVLTRPWQFVSIKAHAPDLENSWIDLDYSLVSRKDQQSYEAYGLAERYSGHDSDGPWREGTRGSLIKIAAVPAGTYDLIVDYSATRWGSSSYASSYASGSATEQPQQAQLVVTSGLFFGSNLLISCLLLALPLIWLAFRHVTFEQARQEQSDFGTRSE